uniref:glutathione transferase n=1 Tax=Cucumis sativus TaxID=3659 RepID=A0A0A0KZT5_CUCSA
MAMGEEVELFGGWMSPFSRRVELGLKLKGIDYKYHEEDLKNKSDFLLTYNPIYKKVPVFLHNGNPISESLIILEYIDQVWNSLYPFFPQQNPYETAQARFWANYIDDKKELQNKKFFGGNKIGIVDIVGTVIAYWIPAIEEAFGFELLTTKKFPKLTKWSEEIVNNSVVKQVLPPKSKLVAYFELQVVSITN